MISVTQPAAAHRSPQSRALPARRPMDGSGGAGWDALTVGTPVGPRQGSLLPQGDTCQRNGSPANGCCSPAIPVCHPARDAAKGALLTLILAHPSPGPVRPWVPIPGVTSPYPLGHPGSSSRPLSGPSAVPGLGCPPAPASAPSVLLAQVRPVSVRSFNPAVVHLGRGAGLSAAQTSHFLTALPGAGPSRAPRAHALIESAWPGRMVMPAPSPYAHPQGQGRAHSPWRLGSPRCPGAMRPSGGQGVPHADTPRTTSRPPLPRSSCAQ